MRCSGVLDCTGRSRAEVEAALRELGIVETDVAELSIDIEALGRTSRFLQIASCKECWRHTAKVRSARFAAEIEAVRAERSAGR